MTDIQFQAWPKIARLNRDMIITEKIDGTNGAIGIKWYEFERDGKLVDPKEVPQTDVVWWVDNPEVPVGAYAVWVQSRTRLITPKQDNHGFAAWVRKNAEALVCHLGEGLHFGEWWGSGIQRGYGLQNGEKRFSLFNTPRYGDPAKIDISPLKSIGVDIVPVLYQGLFNQDVINFTLKELSIRGSSAAPGFRDPEGIVVYHVAAGVPFKVTIKGDEKPKGSNEPS
jgi:hypothetical protein